MQACPPARSIMRSGEELQAGMPISILSQENTSDILAGVGVDHDEIDLPFGPIVDLVEGAKIEFLVNQNRSGIDGGANEFEPDRFASSMWHRSSMLRRVFQGTIARL